MPRKRLRGRHLDNVVSLRLDDPLLAEVRRLAVKDETSPGEWMRQAIARAAFEQGKPPALPGFRHTGFQCAHLSLTAGGVELGMASCGMGCDMLPVYERILAAA
jgi:hypothetical protein